MTFFTKSKVFVIAEIANNHEGNFDILIELINECSKLKI